MSVRDSLSSIRNTLLEVLYGMALHEMVRSRVRERAHLEHLFLLISFGDLLGIPILPPYYSLGLFPYVVPQIQNWRRRMLRERDVLDLIA
ncbi:MAG: hypothetical protein ACRDG5_06100 [Anaerolineales bacterium]